MVSQEKRAAIYAALLLINLDALGFCVEGSKLSGPKWNALVERVMTPGAKCLYYNLCENDAECEVMAHLLPAGKAKRGYLNYNLAPAHRECNQFMRDHNALADFDKLILDHVCENVRDGLATAEKNVEREAFIAKARANGWHV